MQTAQDAVMLTTNSWKKTISLRIMYEKGNNKEKASTSVKKKRLQTSGQES